jgi:hypothetical protein
MQRRFRVRLTPEALAEIEQAQRIARERPWEPIAFGMEPIEV